MDLNKAYGAGLKNGYVRTADGNVYDINAIIQIDASNDQTDTEIKGDDEIKVTFSSGRKETLTVTANGLTFDAIAAITGNTVSSSASGMEIPLGTISEMNPPFVEIGGEVNGKADDGTSVVLKKVWHKVQLGDVKVNMQNETEFSLEMAGTAYQTDEQITGDPFAQGAGTHRTATLYTYAGQAV